MPQNPSQYSKLFLENAYPALRQIIMTTHELNKPIRDMLYDVVTSEREIEQSVELSGFGNFVETPEGQAHYVDSAYQLAGKTFEHAEYTQGFSVSRKLIEDDRYGLIQKFGVELGRSATNTIDIQAAALFNDAFNGSTYTTGSGNPLCYASHPLVSGTFSNLLASADLNVATYQAAVNLLEDTVSPEGKLLAIKPKYLVVPKEKRWIACQLMKSQQLPGTPNNNYNSLLEVPTMPLIMYHLEDIDAWFLIADKMDHDIKWYSRKPLEINKYFKDSTGSMVVYGRMRHCFGFNHPRGIVGSAGA